MMPELHPCIPYRAKLTVAGCERNRSLGRLGCQGCHGLGLGVHPVGYLRPDVREINVVYTNIQPNGNGKNNRTPPQDFWRERVKRYRREKHISQLRLANILGISEASVWAIETGRGVGNMLKARVIDWLDRH